MRVEESVIIHRPVEDVFGFLEVRSNDAAWMASVLESQWLNSTAADSDTPIELGRRGRMIMQLPGRRAEFIDEVTEYEPGRRIAHRTISGWWTAGQRWAETSHAVPSSTTPWGWAYGA